ncbi:hypothetical protein SAY87_028481 [Trapa incisa]|uniref:Sey1/RHD3-like three-helix bundle domain-containing protein n=1 Tax=Trapa incisa TaxID=236973 RepID=A0AAN7QPA6_9MYRT|nr:hypothetical protein SAY87_028481 [Trapa incisa]
MICRLQEYATKLVEKNAMAKAKTVLGDMKERFVDIFACDDNDIQRKWEANDDFHKISEIAFSASLMLLSVVAAIRLDDGKDNIYGILKDALLPTDKGKSKKTALANTLDSTIWPEKSAKRLYIIVGRALRGTVAVTSATYTVTGWLAPFLAFL